MNRTGGRRTVGKLHVNVHSSETGLSGWNRYPLCREGKKWASAASTTDSSLSPYVQLNHRTVGREESAHCSGEEGTFDPASERHKGVDWQR